MSFIKQVTNKPWERKGIIGPLRPVGAFPVPAEKVALSFFLVVVAVIFSLFSVSYFIRMELSDWAPRTEPAQLWFNTGLLIISSILFQWTRNLLKRGETRNLKTSLVGGGVFAIAFIVSQLLVWNKLRAEGITMTSNPADSFFYLLTGLHGLHLLGGLWVWSKTTIKLLSGNAEPKDIRLSVELCTVYWHALLVVWLVLFGILANT
ncbi:MAG: cytochrome c oxidase subunit 3 [Gammaproteobacteria bacterium]|nr:cytochrome c oxidase subunit 3 [Pseudomonadales bacterium]MCP5347780.1 cytochrome c oxidase subunit 3 [Pseudomonadales bacterium]